MSGGDRFELVRKEIAYAYEKTTFFRKHMEANGLCPEDIRDSAEFMRLPPTTKADYRRNFPAGVLAEGYTLNSRHVMLFQSSVTSGERLNSAILAYDLARRHATAIGVNRRFDQLWRPGNRPRTCRFAPPNCSDVECASGYSTVEDRTLPDGTLVLTVAHDLLTTPEWQVIQALDEIELYEPDLLVVDPSHFAFLSRCARRLGREIKVSRSLHVVCGYTLMTRVARRQIEEFMGSRLPIGDMVGMSELGYLGFECHFGARHINNVDFYVEFIRDGKPVAMGEIGELYVTTLDDALLPRIRYATGDFFTPLSSRCECGTDLPRVRLEGRGVHMVQLPDDRVVTPGTIDEIVGEAPGIDLYRLEQERTGESVFRYIAGDSAEPEEIRALELRLVKALEPTPVRTEAVDYIACDRSGKFQSCVSHLSEERAR